MHTDSRISMTIKSTITAPARINTASWLKRDMSSSYEEGLSSFFSCLIPKRFITFSSKLSIGRNSKRAKDLSDLRKMSAFTGSRICQARINTTNCRRVTIFHRYFRPIDRKMFRIRLPMEKVAKADSSYSASCSSSSSSFWVSYYSIVVFISTEASKKSTSLPN